MRNWIKGLVLFGVVGCMMSAEAAFPLKVDIDVTTKRSRKMIAAGDDGSASVEVVQIKAKISKQSGDVPPGKLTAELYAIGKQVHTDTYGIIDVRKGEIELNRENDFTVTYESPEYRLGQTQGNINVGGTYETYLIVVSDAEGNMIGHRSGRKIKDEGVAFIRELGPKTLFDKDGNVIGKVENEGEAFKKAVPAAASSNRD